MDNWEQAGKDDEGQQVPAPETGRKALARFLHHWKRWIVPLALLVAGIVGFVSSADGVRKMIWPDPAPLVLNEGSKALLIDQLQAKVARLEAERDGASVEKRVRLQAQLDVLAGQLANIDQTYQETLEENRKLRLALGYLGADVPEDKLNEALRAVRGI